MKLLFLAFFILILGSLEGYGQTVTFNERLSLGYPNTVFTGIEVTDSCYYVSGVVKTISTGATAAFIAKFDTLGNEVFHQVHLSAETWSPYLHTTRDGNLEVAPYIYDSVGIRGAIYTYNTDGNLVQQKIFDSPFGAGRLIRPDDMQLTPDTGHIIVSAINALNNVGELCVTKLSQQGQVEWQITRGEPQTGEDFACVLLDTDSTYVIGYQQDAVTGSPGTSIIKSHIERLDKNGDTIWTYTSPSNQQIYGVNDLVHTKDSGFVAASAWGYEEIIGSGNAVYYHHSYLYKLNQQGQLVWDRVFYSEYDDLVEFTKVLELEDSSIVAFGKITRAYPQPNPTTSIRRGRIVKVSPRGDSLWNREYEYLTTHASDHTIYDVEQTPDGGFLIAGEANGVGSGVAQQGWLLKIDEHGCLVPGCHILSATVPEPQEQLELQLYPNPCQQYLNVYYPIQEATGKTLEWRLIDVQGRVVQYYERPDVGAKTYIFDVQGLSTGIYFLELRRDGVVLATEEILKQ